jgi:hypothetical protein
LSSNRNSTNLSKIGTTISAASASVLGADCAMMNSGGYIWQSPAARPPRRQSLSRSAARLLRAGFVCREAPDALLPVIFAENAFGSNFFNVADDSCARWRPKWQVDLTIWQARTMAIVAIAFAEWSFALWSVLKSRSGFGLSSVAVLGISAFWLGSRFGFGRWRFDLTGAGFRRKFGFTSHFRLGV